MRPIRRTRRRAAYLLLIVLGLGPWLTVFGAGLYYRSPLYRWSLERELTEFFGLPTRVGRVLPLSWRQRLVNDVEIFLPANGGDLSEENRIARCKTAQWITSSEGDRFDLALTDGELDLTPARWARGDLVRLERSLRHNYLRLDLNRVGIYRSSVRWGHGDFQVDLGRAEGIIWFVGRGEKVEGVARLSAGLLNGEPAAVTVQARFDPLTEANGRTSNGRGEGLVHEFTLASSPDRSRPIPLGQFRLDRLLGGPVTAGTFAGQLTYQARAGERRNVFTIRESDLAGVQLAEFTRWLPSGPIGGQVDLQIKQLEIEQARPRPVQAGAIAQPAASRAEGSPADPPPFELTRLQFTGTLSELDLARTLAAAGLPACSGTVWLKVEHADLMPGPIRQFRAAGRAGGLDLAQLSALMRDRVGAGRIRGPAKVENFKLVVSNGRLDLLEADILGDASAWPGSGPALPLPSPPDKANAAVVDTKLIEAIVPGVGWLKRLPVSLPAAIPYRALAVQAFQDGDKLALAGLGGSDKKSLMTLVIPTPNWSHVMGVAESTAVDVPAPGRDKPFDLTPLVRWLARPLEPIPLRAVGQTIRHKLMTPPTSQPQR